uniref:BTB/POZ domain-containing protein 9 n=1 Tax=Setaria digitata TaxID=48799 RepID=A0A915PWL1_9BILA
MSDNHPQLHGDGFLFPYQSSGSAINLSCCGTTGEIQHINYLAEHIGNLFISGDCSDITLKVEGRLVPAHRVILAARSQYFRALLYNGMRETRDSEIELVDTSLNGFKMLMKYIYTGKLSLSSMKEELVLEVLGLAHKYGFTDLEISISEYMKAMLNIRNVCTIYSVAHLYSLRSLCDVCLNFADKHASEVIATQSFLQLPASAVEQMVQRDSLCAPEIDIFRAVREWIRQHPDQVEDAQMIVARLRLSLIKLDDLLNVIRPSGLVASDAILDAIKERSEKKSGELTYRVPDVNVMSPAFNAIVLTGEGSTALLSGETNRYDMERGFTTHAIGDKNPGIVVQLGRPFIINHIRLLLWDRDQRSYNYYVEISMDQEVWVRVIDHTQYLCRSRQMLYFSPRVVNFIRIVGTYNTVNNSFHLVSIEAMYTAEPFDVDPITTLLVPNTNVATIANNAIVIEGVSRSRNALINGETSNYDWDNGYTCHQLGSGAIVVQLPQPYLIDSIRLLLWDCDDRHYSYYVEVSCDNMSWIRVADKTQEHCSLIRFHRAWQILKFDRRPVVFIRLVGTHNSVNEVFHCVHFECPAQRSVLTPLETFDSNTLLSEHERTEEVDSFQNTSSADVSKASSTG